MLYFTNFRGLKVEDYSSFKFLDLKEELVKRITENLDEELVLFKMTELENGNKVLIYSNRRMENRKIELYDFKNKVIKTMWRR